jgi:hypothetical protein
MRVIIMAAVLIAALVGGFLVYRGNGSEHLGPAAPAVAPLHTECTVADAVYQYNEDQRLQLRFRRVPRAADAGPDFANGAGGHQIGNMMFVVTVTSFATEYVFTPVNRMAAGPAYSSYVLYVRPQTGGGAQMPVQLFNSEMHMIPDMPRDDSVAPGYIIMPDLTRRLYADHIDLPTGAFRFYRCERPRTQQAPAQTP